MHNRQSGAAHVPMMLFILMLLLAMGAAGFGFMQQSNNAEIQKEAAQARQDLAAVKANDRLVRDYVKSINDQVTANNPKEVLKIATTFQGKVVKVLENTLASAESTEFARAKLAQYTASRTAFKPASAWFSTWGPSTIPVSGTGTVLTALHPLSTLLCASAAIASGVSPPKWVYIRTLSRTAPPKSSYTGRPNSLPLMSHSAWSIPESADRPITPCRQKPLR